MINGDWITTIVGRTAHWAGKLRRRSQPRSNLKTTGPTRRSRRRCRLILRSGLRPSLRISLPEQPRFSHKVWYKIHEGVTFCHAAPGSMYGVSREICGFPLTIREFPNPLPPLGHLVTTARNQTSCQSARVGLAATWTAGSAPDRASGSEHDCGPSAVESQSRSV